jgi:hypothetical protein
MRIGCLNLKLTGIAAFPVIILIAFLFVVAEGNAEELENKKTSLDYQWAVSIYGGPHARHTLNDIISFNANYSDGNMIIVGALSREVYNYKQYMSFELEGLVGKPVGDDDSIWEFAGLGKARWQMFPWDDILDTSIAIGAGFSYYTDISQIEKDRNEEAQRLLGYLAFELTFGIPKLPRWHLLMRIHHRSSMGTIIGEGASNYVCVGLKYGF